MYKAKLAVFDLDGTLLDTLGDLAAAVNHSLSEAGFPTHEMTDYRKMIGHGVRNLVKNALPEGTADEIISQRLESFKTFYAAHIDLHTQPYPGMRDLLVDLQKEGVKLAVASNKLQSGTMTLIKEFFPDIDWVAILGDSPCTALKPDPMVIETICRKAGLGAGDTVMIGDAGSDIETARNAGVRSIAVSWGFRPIEDLAGADAIAHDSFELKNLI